MRFKAIATVLRAYLAARARQALLRDRAAVGRYQHQRLQLLMRHAAQNLPFYRAFAHAPFEDWPIIDKAALLANFGAMNRSGLSADEVRNALAAGHDRLAHQLIGMSTGTSGNRGYYIISEQERFVWLGTILAKTLPDALWRRHRIALAMPAMSGLYRSAALGSRINLAFFDLAAGPEACGDALTDFTPDTIVAPPKVLRWLAERGTLRAMNIFSSAEVLDPLDRRIIEQATGVRVREIYMATEGLFGVSCREGTLHLAEDVVHFDFSRPDAASPLASPIVTDFTRRAQGLIRYRMNDLIELDPAPCACGSAFRAVKRIEGRCDDMFLLRDRVGTICLVSPDMLRNAVVDADPAIRDFRIIQTGPATIRVTLEDSLPDTADAQVLAALRALFERRSLDADISIDRGITVNFTHKLRRVSRQWQPPDQP